MIPGVAAEMLLHRPVVPVGEPDTGTVPDGATWHLDFTGGYYYADGAFQFVSTILGGAFNEGDIGATGMDTTYDTTTNRPKAIGTLRTDMLALFAAGSTTVIEVDGDPYGQFVTYINTSNPTLATMGAEAWAQVNVAVDDWDALYVPGAVRPSTPSIHRIAWTLYRDIGGGSFESAISVDGGAAYTGTTSYGGTFITPAAIAIAHGWDLGVANAGWVCRSMTGYPAVDNTTLAALSGSGGAAIATADGSASAAATAIGIMAATAAAAGSASAIGTATATAAGINSIVGSASATGTATAVAMAITNAAGSAGATSTATAVLAVVATLSATQTYNSGGNSPTTVTTAASQALGTYVANRKTLLSIGWKHASANCTLNTVTVGGASATRSFRRSASAVTQNEEIWEIDSGTGTALDGVTSASIVLTYSSNNMATTMVTYRATELTLGPTNTASGTSSVTITVPAGGVVLVASQNSISTAYTISNVTNDYTFSQFASHRGVHGSKVSTAGESLTSTMSSTSTPHITAAAFAPGA